ncbi:MAG: glycosyltransferase, partial [Candidatus Omnitrophica bacterium]|nr:glycosyltransferase [Candidatus Omnitrophota bacterium]
MWLETESGTFLSGVHGGSTFSKFRGAIRLAGMKPIVSIVIPAYNEEDCLAEVHDRLTQVLSKLETAYEILFVDDGSADGTFERIRSISDRDPTVRGLRLSRNFGHQAALTAGLEMARGEAVITMDA